MGGGYIAEVRVGAAFPDDAAPAVTYAYGDHLGSVTVVVDDTGAWVNREEYTPYGETSFGSFARKRFRFTGRPRDAESGLSYHGARYYAPHLGRWTACDPTGPADGLNLYAYACGSPLRLIDPTGTDSQRHPQEEAAQASLPEVHGTPAEESAGATLPDEHQGTATPAAGGESDNDRKIDFPQTAGTGVVTKYETAQRLRYSRDIKSVSDRAVAGIQELRIAAQNGSESAAMLAEAETLAKEASAFRNSARTATQTKLTPGGRIMSELLERPPTWESSFQKYGGTQSFDTFENVALAAGRGRVSLKVLTSVGRVAGPVAIGVGVVVGAVNIVEATPAERPKVATKEVGGFAGGAVGGSAGMAVGAGVGTFVAGAAGLASGPAGWLVLGIGILGGGAGGYFGSQAGSSGAAELYDVVTGDRPAPRMPSPFRRGP